MGDGGGINMEEQDKWETLAEKGLPVATEVALWLPFSLSIPHSSLT